MNTNELQNEAEAHDDIYELTDPEVVLVGGGTGGHIGSTPPPVH